MYERGLDSAPPLREEAEVHGVLPRALPRQVHPVRSGLVRSGLVPVFVTVTSASATDSPKELYCVAR